ncbi:MAG: FAD-binding oxidoreductase [Hyphomicrobiales bacterium]|nr:FAD-binding oxidoreductase [Hyphomicrobiales bacterium]
MQRRQLLKGGLAVAAGAVGSRLLPAVADEVSPIPANRLAAFARDLVGTVVDQTNSTYGMVSQPWNARFADIRPMAIVLAANEGDVARAIAFARDQQVDFVIRNGRHSFAGYSATPGMIIDIAALNAVNADMQAETATVGTGMTNLPLYEALWPHRMVVPAGTCPTVGITGLALGGGFGRLSPLHGLTCDNLLGVRMVTADGRIVQADDRENSNLLWACRGGGGGNFGAVTELTFRLQPVDMAFTEINYTFGWESALQVFRAWQQWIAELPREGHCELELITGDPTGDGATVEIDFVFAGDPQKAEALGWELQEATGAQPLKASQKTASFVSTERDWICAGLRPSECTIKGLAPDGTLARTAIYIGSDLIFEPWPDSGLERLIEAIEKRQRDRTFTPENFDADAQVGKVLCESCGGAINDTASDATAFPHRGMLYMAQYQSRWLPGSSQEIADRNIAWTRQMYESVSAYRSGASYSNYTDPDLADWQHAYYGANLPRLSEIKKTYDPNNVFRFPQSIPPA